MGPRKAVIVGYDAVSPLGTEWEIQWERAVRGESGIGPLTRFPLSVDFPVRVAGEVAPLIRAPIPFYSPGRWPTGPPPSSPMPCWWCTGPCLKAVL